MFAMTRTRLLVATVILVPAFAALLAFAVFSSSANATHSWNGYHWARTSNPFTLKLGDNVSSAWDSYLCTIVGKSIPAGTAANGDCGSASNSVNNWDSSQPAYSTYRDELNPQVVAGGINPKKCSPKSGQVEVCNARYGKNGWLGLASIWIDSNNHITQGTTKLNDSYYTTGSKYDTPGWRNLVVCQEVGHTFGLDHQDENFDNTNLGTCMDYASNPLGPPDNEYPNQGDYDQLTCIYDADPATKGKTLSTDTHSCTVTGHTDSSSTISANAASKHPAAMNAMDTSNPKEWGKLVQKKGRYEVYERDFGGGNKVRTWVIKADGTDVAPEGTTRPEATTRPETTAPVSTPTT